MHYRAVLPNVYIGKDVRPTLEQRTARGLAVVKRRATIAGAAAAAIHGAHWIPDDVPVELMHTNPRRAAGVLIQAWRAALMARRRP